jgi:hypothetical protein
MASNAPLEMVTHFVPTIELTNLDVTQRGKIFKRAADDVGSAKKTGAYRCIFMPYDVSAIAVVFDFLATTFGFLQTMLRLSCIVFCHCFVCVHICFAAKCLPMFFL